MCKTSQGRITELARGGQDQELRDHMRGCSACQRGFDAQLRLTEAAAVLSADAMLIPPLQLEAALLAEFDRTHSPRVPTANRWYAGAAIAAALLLTWAFWRPAPKPQPKPETVQTANILLPPPSVPESPRPAIRARRKAPKARAPEPEQPFVAIPYTAPLGPNERADIVRMDIPVSALIAAGFPLEVADPGARARADLVVSEDGRARAVRLISISNSTNRSF